MANPELENYVKRQTLDDIAIRHETDKASRFSRTYAKPHDYCRHLERFFAPMRDKPIKLLEIGVGGGESIRTWLEYFPCASVVGVDMVEKTNTWNTPHSTLHHRYEFCQGDQSSKIFWQCFIADFGKNWDVIIDDGSHVGEHIITTFYALWPHVSSGGIYEIEDLIAAPGAAAWLRSMSEGVHLGWSDIDSLHFSQELAILVKR
jgi:hypothetical protein